jgi:predicted NUDIX family phosphoesterase
MSASNMIAFIPRELLQAHELLKHGLHAYEATLLSMLEAWCDYAPRPELELDPSRKQLIPYVVLEDAQQQLWTMRRKKTQAEARLHERLSIGVGGHMEQEDGRGESDGGQQAPSPILNAMQRELEEELFWPSQDPPPLRFYGLINDDTTPVGQVHLGLCFVAKVEQRPISIREHDKMEGWWERPARLQAQVAQLESWSALALSALYPSS